ncbi:type I-F CRISPR-associated protein Csy1 [Methylotuvimicrobium sp.]|uniref:type I-F CRISPR-associated protein Csy1 n=1 Tax=Methylotuvimicrobium sp. TaxID=2822413 RepID=UPI003D64BB65
MTNDANKLSTWEEVIKEYIDGLDEHSKKEEYLNELISKFYFEKCIQAETADDVDRKILENDLKKIRTTPVTQKNKPKLEKYYDSFIQRGWLESHDQELKKLKGKNCFYNIWICRALMLGNGVQPATHVAKLTHSSSGGSSMLDDNHAIDHSYVTTSSLTNKNYDGAYPDAKFSKIVKFLMLKNGNMLSEEIKRGNLQPLSKFADKEGELDRWMNGFQRNLAPSLKSDCLAKQIYFPVENDYHLLTVMKSSSLAHSLFLKNFEKSAKKQQEKLKKSKSQQRYHQQPYLRSINVAKISTTLSQPQNVSVLNGARGGRLYLFSSQPPTWQSQLKPPANHSSLFYAIFLNTNTRISIDYLRDFLLRYQNIDLSIRDPKRRKWIDKWVNDIIDEVLSYAADIQNQQASWTAGDGIKLKPAHQYFLDPYRDDDAFQKARKANDWQAEICNDFARWLNYKLIGKDKKFTPQKAHSRIWAELLAQPLRENNQMIEADMPIREEA